MALHIVINWALIWLDVELVLGNVGGGPHHMQGHDTRGMWIGFKEASIFDSEYSSNDHLRLFFIIYFSIPMFSPKANMIFFNVNHIAICMWNNLKCWFKHLLP